MEFKTKYNVGDTVYFLHLNNIESSEIKRIKINYEYETEINYVVLAATEFSSLFLPDPIGNRKAEFINKQKSPYLFREEELFLSKEELINNLSKQYGN